MLIVCDGPRYAGGADVGPAPGIFCAAGVPTEVPDDLGKRLIAEQPDSFRKATKTTKTKDGE